jgi:hypothetical protein
MAVLLVIKARTWKELQLEYITADLVENGGMALWCSGQIPAVTDVFSTYRNILLKTRNL